MTRCTFFIKNRAGEPNAAKFGFPHVITMTKPLPGDHVILRTEDRTLDVEVIAVTTIVAIGALDETSELISVDVREFQ